MTLPGREPDVDALRTDRYLDSLLAAADRRANDVPADAAIDEPLRRTAARLRRDLVRVHPSFRFEERLAARLASEATRTQLAPAVGAEGSVASIPVSVDDPAEEEGFRPLLIGGALTSAALSIAGAAYVAWRRTRPSRPGEARATRQRDRDRSTAARAR